MKGITVYNLAKIVQRHYPKEHAWAKDYKIVLNWVAWFAENQFAICVRDEHRLIGCALVRPVMHPQDGLEDYKFDHEGPILFVDFFYAVNNRALRALVVAGTQRFGVRRSIAFQRRNNKLHVISTPHFALHVLKKDPHDVEA